MGLWNWFKSLFGKGDPPEDAPIIALVLLVREPRFLDEDMLRELINTAWDADLRPDDPDATEFVVGASPSFMVQYRERHFLVNNFAAPYVEDVDAAAADMKELRRRQAFEQHKAWLSVDLLGDASSDDLSEAYRMIGKLVAALADGDTLAIYSTATKQMIPYDADLDAKLRSSNVLEEVFGSPGKVPVIEVGDDDPRLKAAEAEARRRWPEFVAAYQKRKSGQTFAVKFPFEDGDAREFMWVTVTAIDGDTVSGKIDNEPLSLRNVKLGSRVRVSAAKLNDWIIADANDMQGGFTIKVIQEIQGGEE